METTHGGDQQESPGATTLRLTGSPAVPTAQQPAKEEEEGVLDSYIYKVLKQVHPDTAAPSNGCVGHDIVRERHLRANCTWQPPRRLPGGSSKAMSIMNSFVNDIDEHSTPG